MIRDEKEYNENLSEIARHILRGTDESEVCRARIREMHDYLRRKDLGCMNLPTGPLC